MNTIKKIVFIIFLFIIILSLSISMKNHTENNKQGDKEKKIIKVAGDVDYPPYEYINKEGEYIGFNVDIIQRIGELEDIEIKVIPMPWDEAIKALEKGDIDLIQGMSVSESRNKKFVFSEPIIENDYVIFTLKENNEITSVIDLQNKKVSYQSSDLAEEFLKVIDRKSIEKETQSDAINLLLNGDVDAFIGNKLTGMYYLQKIGFLHKIKVQGSPLLKNNYSVVGNQNSINTIKIINNGIDKLKSTNEYEKIYSKWFGDFLEENNNTLKVILITIILIFIVAIIVIFNIAFFKEKYKKIYIQENKEKKVVSKEFNVCKVDILKKEAIIKNLINKEQIGIIILDENFIIENFNNKAQELLEFSLEKGIKIENLDVTKLLWKCYSNLDNNLEYTIEINSGSLKNIDIKISKIILETEKNLVGFVIKMGVND